MKQGKYTAEECISDLMDNVGTTAGIVAVILDTDGDIHIRGSHMKNCELTMCAVMLNVYVQKYLTGEIE